MPKSLELQLKQFALAETPAGLDITIKWHAKLYTQEIALLTVSISRELFFSHLLTIMPFKIH